jgi:hypothetical protein
MPTQLTFEKAVKPNDNDIANFKQYDHFCLLLALGILTFLHETLGMAALSFPEALLKLVKDNENSTLLVFQYFY